MALHLWTIEFVSQSEGWLSSITSIPGPTGEIWHTMDGGQTWQSIAETPDGGVFDILFLSPKEGWIALSSINPTIPKLGIKMNSSGIIHTQDGGKSWEVELEVPSTKDGYMSYITDIIYDPITQSLWATGNYKTIYKRSETPTSVSSIGKIPLTWGQIKQFIDDK